jgi:response regulator RpfG family c-di-GMP phosphodiesterase
MDPNKLISKKRLKKKLKKNYAITNLIDIEELLEAMLLADQQKLDLIISEYNKLKDECAKICSEIDSSSDAEYLQIVKTMRRPSVVRIEDINNE